MEKYTVTEYEMKDYDDFKNNLTDEKAIGLLERISRGYLPDYNFTGTEGDYDNYCLRQAIYRAIDALKEVQQYRRIGTVEECRDAVGKQTAVELEYEGDTTDSRGRIIDDTWVWICPTCGKEYEMDCDNYRHCPECGQAIRQKGEADEG